jgi:hypothetical protein
MRAAAAAYIRDVDMKSLQANKLKEIGYALVVSGLATLDRQASALGISRSTAWTILNAKHKTSGLSAIVINQMLMAPQLPPLVRAKLFEYIEDKIAGAYGHSPQQVRRFAARLMAERLRYSRKIANERSTAKPHASRFGSFRQESSELRELADSRVALERMRFSALRRSS